MVPWSLYPSSRIFQLSGWVLWASRCVETNYPTSDNVRKLYKKYRSLWILSTNKIHCPRFSEQSFEREAQSWTLTRCRQIWLQTRECRKFLKSPSSRKTLNHVKRIRLVQCFLFLFRVCQSQTVKWEMYLLHVSLINKWFCFHLIWCGMCYISEF